MLSTDYVLVLILFLLVSAVHFRHRTCPDRHLEQVPPNAVPSVGSYR